MNVVPLWKSRLDFNGDGIVWIPGSIRPSLLPRPYEEIYDINCDGMADFNIIKEAMKIFTSPTKLNRQEQRPIIIAPFYLWYEAGINSSWSTAQSIPLRGRYDSKNPKVYLEQRLEAHRNGIDVFAVSTFQHREFMNLLNTHEVRKKGPKFNEFFWLYEIFDSLKITYEDFRGEIVQIGDLRVPIESGRIPVIDFDNPFNRNKFIQDTLDLSDGFDENYMLLDGKYFPVWFWVTDIFRGDFRSVAIEARKRVNEKLAKKYPGKNYEIIFIGGENSLFQKDDEHARNRLSAFYGTAGYGIYTPLFARFFNGRLSKEHTDLIMDRMEQGTRVVENTDTIYGQKCQLFGISQFGYKDNRGNPVLIANTSEILYFMQQLQKRIFMGPNRPNLEFHISYNEHREGHAVEPTDGYNFGNLWLLLLKLFFGASYYFRKTYGSIEISRV
jgi:hypothetical protein